MRLFCRRTKQMDTQFGREWFVQLSVPSSTFCHLGCPGRLIEARKSGLRNSGEAGRGVHAASTHEAQAGRWFPALLDFGR